MKKIAIKGSQDYSERQEILEILESLGGINTHHYLGNCLNAYYYINYDNVITWKNTLSSQEYELLTLKEYKEKYMNTETKEFKIEIPKGYEVDKENSTFEKIVFKKVEEKLTYTKVANKLFKDKDHYYIDEDGTIILASTGCQCPNNAPTKQQLNRLLALNKLMNIAHYLNDGWEPNWKDKSEGKYCIIFNGFICIIANNVWANHGGVIFKSMELAEQAIEILGEETVKLALGVC